MKTNGIPDVVGLKLPAAAELLGAAGIPYVEKELRPHGVRKREQEKEQDREGEMRVVRQQLTPENTLILSVCSIYE